MDFEIYIDRNLEDGMQEELCCKIGDLCLDKSVDLEELCEHSAKVLQHLFRLMVENTGLELKAVDDMALYFNHLKCGHEFYLPWVNVVDDVSQMVKNGDLTVRCNICQETKEEAPPKEKKTVSTKLKASDLEKAEDLQFLFLEPVDKLPTSKKNAVKKLEARINVRLSVYKLACKTKNMKQVKNAGLALKNGVNFMRREHKVKCAVKLSPEGN